MKYKINKPVKFTDHFLLYEDKTSWDGEYIKTKNGNFPSYLDKYREQNITNYKNYIKATTKYAQQYCFSGVYIIFFCELKMYYVGIATENIVDRLSKHIVKVFGSYLGQGINHTNENTRAGQIRTEQEASRAEPMLQTSTQKSTITLSCYKTAQTYVMCFDKNIYMLVCFQLFFF